MDCITALPFSSHAGTLSSFEDAQRFESVFKMTRKTFSYICSLVKGPLMNNMDIHTFVDGKVLSLQDEVAVALRRLNSRGSAWDLGYTIGVNESTVLSVTKRFSDALFAGTGNPWSWRDSSKIDNIKSMFAEIHNMHNCCGVICTTNIPFGPEGDHENKDNILMQVIVDAKMRFMNILLVPAGSMNQLSLFHACYLFEECNKGAWLNGRKLKVALDGSEVGEYIIGDAGYPLLPWLLTPYQEENFSDSKKEFNRRHSAATTWTLSSFEDAQRFESVFKMTRKTFSYICSLVKGPLMNNMDIHTFVDGKVLSLQDEVAVALRRLNSRGSAWDLGYTIGVNESTVLSVTKRFSDALFAGTGNPWSWRDSSKIDNIKSMFAEIHNMHNCCGVICTTNIPFGPEGDHEIKDNILMQVIVDAKMRFMNILLVPAGSMNQLSLFHACYLFEECNKGAWLNGRKLKVALDGSEVGEYIIGDAGYPLLPWLLTPYQEENFSDSKKEFNRRHSAATTCALKALARLKDTWKLSMA
uniref:Uncharacterized protein n=1 Tax=Avena sativa TaxID=4498 RepID=A0ACD6AUY7_AVESA